MMRAKEDGMYCMGFAIAGFLIATEEQVLFLAEIDEIACGFLEYSISVSPASDLSLEPKFSILLFVLQL